MYRISEHFSFAKAVCYNKKKKIEYNETIAVHLTVFPMYFPIIYKTVAFTKNGLFNAPTRSKILLVKVLYLKILKNLENPGNLGNLKFYSIFDIQPFLIVIQLQTWSDYYTLIIMIIYKENVLSFYLIK